jgi:citrate lyase beta subunit
MMTMSATETTTSKVVRELEDAVAEARKDLAQVTAELDLASPGQYRDAIERVEVYGEWLADALEDLAAQKRWERMFGEESA